MKRYSGSWIILAIATLLALSPIVAAVAEEAGCLGSAFQPRYAPLGMPPLVEARSSGDGTAPAGSECFGLPNSAGTWIMVASLVSSGEGRDELLRRVGAVSGLLTVQYWSTTDREWRALLSYATALATVSPPQPRSDFSAEELRSGQDHFFLTTDTRTGQQVAYRMRTRLVGARRVVVETANLLAVKRWGVTLYGPGGLDTLYVLDERSPGVWAYYSIARVVPANFLGMGHPKSYINRAVALYRHFMRIPTNAEPPAAP